MGSMIGDERKLRLTMKMKRSCKLSCNIGGNYLKFGLEFNYN